MVKINHSTYALVRGRCIIMSTKFMTCWIYGTQCLSYDCIMAICELLNVSFDDTNYISAYEVMTWSLFFYKLYEMSLTFWQYNDNSLLEHIVNIKKNILRCYLYTRWLGIYIRASRIILDWLCSCFKCLTGAKECMPYNLRFKKKYMKI